MNTQQKIVVVLKRATLARAVVIILFLLALVLFHFANKDSTHYQQLYEKSIGKKVE